MSEGGGGGSGSGVPGGGWGFLVVAGVAVGLATAAVLRNWDEIRWGSDAQRKASQQREKQKAGEAQRELIAHIRASVAPGARLNAAQWGRVAQELDFALEMGVPAEIGVAISALSLRSVAATELGDYSLALEHLLRLCEIIGHPPAPQYRAIYASSALDAAALLLLRRDLEPAEEWLTRVDTLLRIPPDEYVSESSLSNLVTRVSALRLQVD